MSFSTVYTSFLLLSIHEFFSIIAHRRDEADEFVEIGALNGIFVLGRSMGFIGESYLLWYSTQDNRHVYLARQSILPFSISSGHYLDQKRLKQGLYRHPWDDISYVLPEHMSM